MHILNHAYMYKREMGEREMGEREMGEKERDWVSDKERASKNERERESARPHAHTRERA